MRPIAHLISYLTHPLLGPTYLLLLLLAVNPYLFGVTSVWERGPLIALVVGSSLLVPGLVILMMRGLEMIDSLRMPARQQRTIPLIAVGMLYLGLFAFCRGEASVPGAYTALVLGSVVGLFAAFFVNLFTKISLHTVGMGGILAATFIILELFSFTSFTLQWPGTGNTWHFSMLSVLLGTILVAGAVGTARLLLRAHRLEDVVGGYLVGFMSMAAAVYFYF